MQAMWLSTKVKNKGFYLGFSYKERKMSSKRVNEK